MTRDAEMRARDFVTLVANGVGSETDITTVQTVLRQAQSAIEMYVDPDHASDSRHELGVALAALLRNAEPGSDHQLAFVRAFAGVASTEEQLDLLSGILDGSSVVDGLVVDTDLRWSLLRRLVQRGRASDEAIDAELAGDPTANGQRQAATIRAARPTAEAKAEAWARGRRLGRAAQRPADGDDRRLPRPDQRDLLRPYVERYFESVGEVWKLRTIEMASNIAIGPLPGAVRRAGRRGPDRRLPRRSEIPPALARLVAEGRDGVERALRARAADRA